VKKSLAEIEEGRGSPGPRGGITIYAKPDLCKPGTNRTIVPAKKRVARARNGGRVKLLNEKGKIFELSLIQTVGDQGRARKLSSRTHNQICWFGPHAEPAEENFEEV
jgi:hypothetical protein